MPDGVSQLCHTADQKVARPAGREPATSWFLAQRAYGILSVRQRLSRTWDHAVSRYPERIVHRLFTDQQMGRRAFQLVPIRLGKAATAAISSAGSMGLAK